MAELMREWTFLNEPQRLTVCDLFTASRRLSTVVNNLIAFSTDATAASPSVCPPSSGGVDVVDTGNDETTAFSIREAVDTAIGYHLLLAESHRLSINVDIPSDIPDDLVGDKGRLICILDQLIGNAVKFTAMGSVSIEVVAFLSDGFSMRIFCS